VIFIGPANSPRQLEHGHGNPVRAGAGLPQPMKIGILASNLLQSVGEPLPSDADPPMLRNVDWHAHGVTHHYVIFMTGRCGSTWLTSVLKNTGLAGNPGEFFNGDVAKRECRSASGLGDYFLSVVDRESSNGRFGIEIDAIRLKQIEMFVDWPSVFPAGSGATFFLYRRDILAQAWSWVSAKKSGLWHIRANHTQPASSVDTLPSEKELAKEIVRIRECEEYLEAFFQEQGYEPHYLDYESLVTELPTEVATILKKLSVDNMDLGETLASSKTSVSKIQYSAKHHVLAEFNHKHSHALALLRRDRFGIGSKRLSELLM
jgi:LPS sulfotransferase NodH